jgi:putative heme-binding domain-containing protein
MKPEDLVDSVLRPSKQIDKAFAQVIVLTNQGKQYTGVRISENADEIVLRNLAQPTPIVIKKEDVDEVFESRTSLMPANLTRQLKTRAEFDDLMKYVLEVRKR